MVIAPYRFMFRKRAVNAGDTTTNYTNFFALVNAASPNEAYSPSGSSAAAAIPDPALLNSIANHEQWMRIFACQRTVGNWDSYGYQRGKNDYAYKGVNGRFEQMTWDIDFTMGVGGNGVNQGLFDTVSDPRVSGMYSTPVIVRGYWRAFQDIINGPLNNSFLDPILDAKAATFAQNRINVDPNTLATVKTYTSQRRAYIASQLATVAANFSLSPANYDTATTNLLVLSGGAPLAIKTMTVTLNGQVYPITFPTVTNWTGRLVLSPGANQIVIQSFDRFGSELTAYRRTNTVNYTGLVVAPQDALVINEIMYNPAVTNASYVELYNNSDSAFELSSWRFDGLDYTFPFPTVLSGRSYLTLARNSAAFASAYGSNVRVFGQFNRDLNPGGQILTLVKPGATPADDVAVAKARYESNPPWPAAANGQGSALQLIDPTLSEEFPPAAGRAQREHGNARVSNWSDGYGWRFVSSTGVINAATNLLIYLAGAGEAYIDDISLVPQSGPLAGSNILTNGDFETPLDNGWIVPATMGTSSASSVYWHSPSLSLHAVATNGGSIANSIRQILPPLDTNTLCTLSFWYRTLNSTNFTVRTYPGNALTTNVNQHTIGVTPSAVNSTLASLPPYPPLWLNELQASNVAGPADGFGELDPWIELYNSGTNALSLDGYFLANNYTNLAQWAFPTGSVISPGQFLIIWADGQPEQSTPAEWHASFSLNGSTGSVALVRLVAGLPQVMDYLNYSGLGAGQSYGDYPDGQPFDRQVFSGTSTPGAKNVAPPVSVLINEWVASNAAGPGGYADPTDGKYDDWFELYNAGLQPANLGGFYLTGNLTNKLAWRIPDGTIIPPGGYLLAWADQENPVNNTNGDLHVNFKLNKGGDSIGLFATSGTNVIQIDAVTFGPQITDISQGRHPDGANAIYFLSATTPRRANAVPGNQPPVLSAIANRTIYLGSSLSFTASATDSDAGQTLTYSLLPVTPVGAVIDAVSGFFHWSPTAPSSTQITVKVSDDGVPSMSDSKSFIVAVILPPRAVIAQTGSSVSLSFPTVLGKTYGVVFKDNLSAPAWMPLDPVHPTFVADAASKTVMDAIGVNHQRFYRIAALD